jgi:hypothetical protein
MSRVGTRPPSCSPPSSSSSPALARRAARSSFILASVHAASRAAAALALGFALLAASACRAKPKSVAGTAPAAGAPAAGGSATVGSARLRTDVAPLLVADSAGIRTYLETVDTVRGATFDVTWNPNSVRLTRDQTLRSLRRVSRDGGTFTFAAGDPAIAALKPGQILLVWGIALRKVTSVEPAGATIVVHTDLVSLPEAIPSGHIAWSAQPADFGQGIVSPSVVPPQPATKAALAPSTSLFRLASSAPSPVRLASWQEGEGQGDQNPEAENGKDGEGGEGAEEAELPHHKSGEVGDYEYEIGYADANGRLEFQLEARKGEEGAFPDPEKDEGERARAHGTDHVGGNGGFDGTQHGAPLTDEEKKQQKEHKEQEEHTKQGVGKPETPLDALTPKGLFGLASEVFDLRVKVRGHIDGFDTSGDISTGGSALGKFKAKVEKLHGNADLDWIARLGERGIFSEKVKLEIPFNYDIPLIIGGLPFMVEIGANLLVTPGLTSRHASANGSYHIVFDGTAGISATGTDVQTESNLTGSVENGPRQVTSVGVSAVLVAAQVPRIGFGLGLLNTSAVAYVDHVIATSVTTEGMLGLIPCRRFQINSSFGAGVGVQVLGIPVPGMGGKKTLGTPYQKVETEPQGFNCKVKDE